MARYPYSPDLPAPGKWSSIDFASPSMSGALRMLVRGIQQETTAYQPPEGIRFSIQTIPVWDGSRISCFVLEPERDTEPDVSMLYCHGGGFFLPVQPMMLSLAAEYAGELGIRVYLPEYRIFPEYRNPYPFRDCLSVLEQITGDYFLYGESAGGALAAGLALYARDHAMRPALGQCLVYPVLDNRCSRYPSMRLYAEAAWPLKNNLAMWREYLKDGKDGLDGYLIPMLAEEVVGLPQAYIEPQELDTLRDEALAYAQRLEQAGVPVTKKLIKGSYHGFDAAIDCQFVRSVVAERVNVMRKMLND